MPVLADRHDNFVLHYIWSKMKLALEFQSACVPK